MKQIELVETSKHTVEAVSFRKDLKNWGRENFRPLPWRFTEDPYHILLAEVMLHRTQASQVVPVYNRFIETYPDVESLVKLEKQRLQDILYSLGLRWRIDLIMDMVLKLAEQYEGKVPQEKADLLLLPGVNDYVASAVRCFAWNLADPIVDTNTVRVAGRIFGLEVKDSSRRNPLFRKLIASLVDPEEPRAYNYGLLDLAAKLCTKVRAPECEVCPIQSYCLFGSQVHPVT